MLAFTFINIYLRYLAIFNGNHIIFKSNVCIKYSIKYYNEYILFKKGKMINKKHLNNLRCFLKYFL